MPTSTTTSNPAPLGLKKSFGYGDRLGLATPGHLRANRRYDFAPIFAQQSIREMQRTSRTPEEVIGAAKAALGRAGYAGAWGADADHLKTPEDVRRTAAAGFCFFTIDPSAYVDNTADNAGQDELESASRRLVAEGVLDPDWEGLYLEKPFDVGLPAGPLRFTRELLYRAAMKYAKAIAHSAEMGKAIANAANGKPFEIEVSVDETDSPTSPLEHLFFGVELRRRKVPNVVSLAPRFVGEMEKGIDYRGDLKEFEDRLREHVAVAKYCGPYKISVHSGSDKFAIYPVIGRVCGDLLHVKTAGTSYLEALRVVARRDPALFAEVAAYSHGRFATDRASYHISTTEQEAKAVAEAAAQDPKGRERLYLDERPGRQVLHVTFGSVLTAGKRANGQTFKDALLGVLHANAGLHDELLEAHFDKHLRLLNAG